MDGYSRRLSRAVEENAQLWRRFAVAERLSSYIMFPTGRDTHTHTHRGTSGRATRVETDSLLPLRVNEHFLARHKSLGIPLPTHHLSNWLEPLILLERERDTESVYTHRNMCV